MKKALALTCAMTMAASLFLTGCGGSDYTTMSGNGSDNNSGSSNGSGKRVVNVCSWGARRYLTSSLNAALSRFLPP